MNVIKLNFYEKNYTNNARPVRGSFRGIYLSRM